MKKKQAVVRGLGELEQRLGHTFARPELLELALTHRSFVYDSGTATAEELADPGQDNEQLEFMGDAALGLLAAEGLCRLFPGSREGELTRMRASVVSRKYLGGVGERLGLGRWLRLGQTTEKNNGTAQCGAVCQCGGGGHRGAGIWMGVWRLRGGLWTGRFWSRRWRSFGCRWKAARDSAARWEIIRARCRELLQADGLGATGVIGW